MSESETSKQCPVCKIDAELSQGPNDGFFVECPSCGKYKVDRLAAWHFKSPDLDDDRHILAGVIRQASDNGHQLALTIESAEKLVEEAPVPSTLFEAMDRMLLHLARIAPDFIYSFKMDEYPTPTVFLKDRNEVEHLLGKMREAGYLEFPGGGKVSLTFAGWERVEELKPVGVKSDQAFVARWFDDCMKDAWENGFRPALVEVGYRPLDMTFEHNEKICDRLIGEIRRSGLLVADFTGNRGSVYYEAGFAQGLEIPIIWTCKKDHMKGLQFDTRQYNHIDWSDPADLRERLIDRIRATVPYRPD